MDKDAIYMRSLILLLLITFLISCSGGEPGKSTTKADKLHQAEKPTIDTPSTASASNTNSAPKTNSTKFNFKREVSYGSTDSVLIGYITAITVDERNRVFIVDFSQKKVHVFQPDGTYITSLGHEGRGPGEFSTIKYSLFIDGQWLYVGDYGSSIGAAYYPTRMQIFSLKDMSFSHTMKILPENRNEFKKLQRYNPNRIFPLSNDRFLISYQRSPMEYRDSLSFIRYMIQDSKGTLISGPVFEQRDAINLVRIFKDPRLTYRVVEEFPFYSKSLLAVSANDNLYVANSTGQFKIDVYNSAGNHMRSFHYPFDNKPLNRSSLLEQYKDQDELRTMISEANSLPNTWPALETMFFDDQDRLWVATIIENEKVYEWWVLKNTGEVIAKFKWPRDKPIKAVRNGFFYTLEEDELEIESVVRYKIEKE